MTKPMPRISSLSRPFWDGCNDGRLMIQKCTAEDCGRFVYYPRVACPHCHRDTLSWEQASGLGSVVTHTTIHRPHHESFEALVPYIFAAVKLHEGPIVFARLKGSLRSVDLLGQSVRAEFETYVANQRILVFSIVDT